MLLIPLPKGGRGGMALLDLLHAPGFAVLTILVLRGLHHWRCGRGIPAAMAVGGLVVVFGWASEILQGFLGRTPTLQDALANTLGVGAGILWTLSRAMPSRGPRLRLVAICGLLLVLASAGPLRVLSDACWRRLESRHASILPSGGAPTQNARIDGSVRPCRLPKGHGPFLRCDG